jgi:hypothetical protein
MVACEMEERGSAVGGWLGIRLDGVEGNVWLQLVGCGGVVGRVCWLFGEICVCCSN